MPHNRIAPFELPYKLSGMYCEGALNKLQTDGMKDAFPADLIKKLEDNAGMFTEGCTITQHDINEMSDQAWNYLKIALAD